MALLDILGCHMEDLIEPMTSRKHTSIAAGQSSPRPEAGVGTFRPKRARIMPEQDA
jgi:hypothetical protein